MKILHVGRDQAGPLLPFLGQALPAFKKTTLKQYLRFRRITINGRIVTRHDHPLAPGDEIRLQTDTKSWPGIELPSGIRILYEDDALIAIHKPAGMLSVPAPRHPAPDALAEVNRFLVSRGGRRQHAQRVHRLDKPASGVLLFAKTSEARRILIDGWDRVEKVYLAIVEGVPRPAQDTITSHLTQDRDMKVRSGEETAQSRLAQTRYRVLTATDGPALSGPRRPGFGARGYALLECRLLTGFKNQIRVQLAERGHPIAGDLKYGARANPIARLALHAWRLILPPPLTHTTLTIESEYPRPFRRLFAEP